MADAKVVEAPRGEAANPANLAATAVEGRRRIPLSVPRPKLDAPKLPGFVLQWFADRPGRLQQAQDAGYVFVTQDEIMLNNTSLAGSQGKSGNTDLGNQVSTHGGVGTSGQAERMYLMKIKEEFWLEDERVKADRNESVAAAIRGGTVGSSNPHEVAGDQNLRYLGRASGAPPRKAPPNIFTRKRG